MIAKALKYLRLKKDIPRRKIAELVGCTEMTLYLIEKEKFGSRKYEYKILEVAKENGFKK